MLVVVKMGKRFIQIKNLGNIDRRKLIGDDICINEASESERERGAIFNVSIIIIFFSTITGMEVLTQRFERKTKKKKLNDNAVFI